MRLGVFLPCPVGTFKTDASHLKVGGVVGVIQRNTLKEFLLAMFSNVSVPIVILLEVKVDIKKTNNCVL